MSIDRQFTEREKRLMHWILEFFDHRAEQAVLQRDAMRLLVNKVLEDETEQDMP